METVINRTFTSPGRDRLALAKWLAKIPAETGQAILSRHGAASLRQLPPGRFLAVLAETKAAIATQDMQRIARATKGKDSGGVSLFSLADAIHATVADIRQRDEEQLAPLRAAVEDAERAFLEARDAADSADSAMREAFKQTCAVGKAVHPAEVKARAAQDGRTHTIEQFNKAVAEYDRVHSEKENAEAAYLAACDHSEATQDALRDADRARDDARDALKKAENGTAQVAVAETPGPEVAEAETERERAAEALRVAEAIMDSTHDAAAKLEKDGSGATAEEIVAAWDIADAADAAYRVAFKEDTAASKMLEGARSV